MVAPISSPLWFVVTRAPCLLQLTDSHKLPTVKACVNYIICNCTKWNSCPQQGSWTYPGPRKFSNLSGCCLGFSCVLRHRFSFCPAGSDEHHTQKNSSVKAEGKVWILTVCHWSACSWITISIWGEMAHKTLPHRTWPHMECNICKLPKGNFGGWIWILGCFPIILHWYCWTY